MAEYIEREALLAEYDRLHTGEPGGARKLIAEAPAADVVEVKRGRWVGSAFDTACSACGIYQSFHIGRTKYCPNCGARMDGE